MTDCSSKRYKDTDYCYRHRGQVASKVSEQEYNTQDMSEHQSETIESDNEDDFLEEKRDLKTLRDNYIEKVNIVANKSRNILLFTEMSKDDVLKTFENRTILSINEHPEYINIKFKDAITEKSLTNKYKIEYFIMFSTFKKNETILTNDDSRSNFLIRNRKKLFEEAGININELDKLSIEQFYNHYPQEFLKPKFIEHVNKYYNEKMIRDMKAEYDNIEWKPFQKTILDICSKKPDGRSIYIIEDVDKICNGEIIYSGNIGKSFTCEKLDLDYNVIIADGKKDNILNQIKCHMDKGFTPNVIILDIPRQGQDYIQYGTLESIKNGLIYSGKYEGGKCRYPKPHMFIFTNFRVDTTKWSDDRVKFIDTKTGKITNKRPQNEDGVYDRIVDEKNECDGYRTLYFELEEKYRALKNDYDNLMNRIK